MFDVLLYEPEIPPNTGNVMRLCANTGSRLHLIKPLGFDLDSRRLKRAGLDYRDLASVTVHENLADCLGTLGGVRVFGFSTRGGQNYASVTFSPGDALLFGPETRGLPDDVLYDLAEERRLRVPMLPDSRSLNLSNSVAVVVYEAWRQQAFSGGA